MNKDRITPKNKAQNTFWLKLVFVLVLIAAGSITYSNSLNVPFCFDDYPNIVDDPYIRMTKLNWESISSLSQTREFERPFSVLTFAINYYFGQYDVFGYHLVNTIIHIINGLLLFLIVRKTLNIDSPTQDLSSTTQFSPDTIAFFTALIWLVHPLHTQSVTYIMQRENSLATMFYILSLLLYIKGRISLNKQKTIVNTGLGVKRSKPFYYYFAGCFFSGIFALANKENAATLPFFILLYEWFFFQDLKNIITRRRLIWAAAAFVIFGIISVIYLGENPSDMFSPAHYRKSFTLFERFITEFRVVIYYIGLIFFPHPGRLNLDYDYPLSTSLIHPATTVICLFAILCLGIMVTWTAKRNRILSFSILWYFGTQAIESSFIPLALVFEHRTYLPSMMAIFLVVMLLFQNIKPRPPVAAFLCGLAIIFSFWTFQRNAVWSDAVGFWENCVEKSPHLYRPYNNLGTALLHQESYDKAILCFQKAIQLDPSKEKAYCNLGLALKEIGKTDEAIRMFDKSLAIKPDFNLAHIGLGNVYLDQLNFHQAIMHFKIALEISPLFSDALNNMGNAYLGLGDPETAIVYFERALETNPYFWEAHNNYGNALMQQNQLTEAISHFNEILSNDPANVEAHINMGVALSRLNKIESAITHYQAAIETAPDNAEAHNNLGVLFVKNNDYENAMKHFTIALHLRPGYDSAQSNIKKLQTLMENR